MGKSIVHERPTFINEFIKPPNTEIKYINGHWYLYEIVYSGDDDSPKKKKSGKIIGTITEDGFKKSRIRKKEIIALEQRISDEKLLESNNVEGNNITEDNVNMNTQQYDNNGGNNSSDNNLIKREYSFDSVEVGATLYFYQKTFTLRTRLKRHFPDIWEKIYVLHLLRLIYDSRFKRLKLFYQCSILSEIFPYIDLSPAGIRAILLEIGRRRSAIREFMKEDLEKKDIYMLIDGHRLITASRNRILPELGYDSKKRYKPQINILYIFVLENYTGSPGYYKQYAGSTPDVNAFEDLLLDCNLKAEDVIAVTDKGFISQKDFELLVESGLQYIIPLKRNNKFVKDSIPASPQYYDAGFVYNHRPIVFKEVENDEDFRIFLYCDLSLYLDEFYSTLLGMEKKNNDIQSKIAKREKILKKTGKLTNEELSELIPLSLSEAFSDKDKIGTITLKVKCDRVNGEQAFLIWKTRQAIEQYFKTYDVTLDFAISYMQDDITEEARLFLNHITGMTAMSCINELDALDLLKDLSLDDIRLAFSRIHADFVDGKWKIKPIKNEILKLCKKLSVDLSDISILNDILKSAARQNF